MTERYRAEITLDRLFSRSEEPRAYTEPVVRVSVTADSAAEAMNQMLEHVRLLSVWHDQQEVLTEPDRIVGPIRVEDIQ